MFSRLNNHGNRLFNRLFQIHDNNGSNRHRLMDYSDFLLDYDTHFYIENYFQDTLYMEKKRSARSGKPFTLMLVNIRGLIDENGTSKHIKEIAHILSSVTRETDITGWYRYNEIMGVIFTDTSQLDNNLIQQKMNKKLSRIVTADQLNKITLSFHRVHQ